MVYEERVAYLEALMYISTADEKVEEEELVYFNQVGQLYGIELEELNKIKTSIINREKSIEEILIHINTRQTKLSLLYELLALCFVDGDYDIVEKIGMKKIADIMGIEDTKLDEIEGLIIENIALQNKINIVLEKN